MNQETKIHLHLDQVLRPIESANGLPNECYTDDSVFKLDRESVMAESWVCVGFGSDVAEGWAVPINFMGYPILLTRSSEGELRVFHNVCSHRGMQLVSEPGKLGTGLIRCKYHSWTYDFKGNLKGTPMIGGTDNNTHKDFDPTVNGLRAIRTQVWMDNIFINISGEAEPFEDFIAPLLNRWSKWVSPETLNELCPGKDAKMEMVVKSNWKLAVENFLEAYHLPWVHPGLNSYSPLEKHYDIDRGENFAGQGSASYTTPAGSTSSISNWPEKERNFAEYPALYPNTLLGLQSDHFFTMTILPIDATTTLERVQLMFPGDVAIDEKYADHRESMVNSWTEVFSEDIFAVEGMQSGRQSPAYRGGVFSPVMDQHTLHFHQWVAKRLHT